MTALIVRFGMLILNIQIWYYDSFDKRLHGILRTYKLKDDYRNHEMALFMKVSMKKLYLYMDMANKRCNDSTNLETLQEESN